MFTEQTAESINKAVQATGVEVSTLWAGWSGLFPISILFEYVFGIRPYAKERKIVWNVNLLEKHGVSRYPLNDYSLDLICEVRESEDDEPIITAICDEPIEIEVRYGNKSKTIYAVPEK